MTSVSFKGDKELLSALEKMARTDVYKEVVKKSGADLQKKAKEKLYLQKVIQLGLLNEVLIYKLKTVV